MATLDAAGAQVSAPYLAAVLANVRPGRNVRLYLSDEQREALADRDGLITRRVIRAHLQARHAATNGTPPYSFLLTAECFTAIARKLGHPVGITRARTMIRRAIACGLLTPAGHYAARRRYLVPLFKLGARIVGLRRAARLKPTVVTQRAVKRRRRLDWWLHPLFGDPSGLPPPGLTAERARRMRPRERTWVVAE